MSDKYEFTDSTFDGFEDTVTGSRRKDDKLVDIRRISKFLIDDNEQEVEESLRAEMYHSGLVDHKFVVNVLEFNKESSPDYYYLVSERMIGGSLLHQFNLLMHAYEVFDENIVKTIMMNLLNALHAFHSQNYVHGEVTMESVFLTTKEVTQELKLGRVGKLSLLGDHPIEKPKIDIPTIYTPPEMLSNHTIGKENDIWNCGVIMFQLLGGYPPFEDIDAVRLGELISGGQYLFHSCYWNHISEDAKNLVRRLLDPNIETRFNIDQARSHSWFGDIAVKLPRIFDLKYKLTDEINSFGCFGSIRIRSVVDKMDLKSQAVVKIMYNYDSTSEQIIAIRKEAEILQFIGYHPNIVQFIDYYDTKDFQIVMERVNGMNIIDYLIQNQTQFTEISIRNLIRSTLKGLEYMHSLNVIHRDIKPENLIVTSAGNLKIIDFSCATDWRSFLSGICGTPNYLSPEMIGDRGYGKGVDMWALAVVIFVLLSGSFPFKGEDNASIYVNIERISYNMNDLSWRNCSENVKKLIKSLFNRNDRDRLTAAKALDHEWFHSDDESQFHNRNLASNFEKLKLFQKEKIVMACIRPDLSTRNGGGLVNNRNGANRDKNQLPFILDNKYTSGKLIEEKGFITTKLLYNKDDKSKKALLRIVNRQGFPSSDQHHLLENVRIMQKLNHPKILQLLDFVEESEKYYIVTEYHDGISLFYRICDKENYSEKEARDISFSLLSSILYCHRQSPSIVNRNLKPDNIHLANANEDCTEIKLTDFSYAVEAEGNTIDSIAGTIQYMAPEVLTREPRYGKAVDMWALGIIIYILISGIPPFYDEDTPQLVRRIRRGKYEDTFSQPCWSNVSEEVKDLIKHLLVVDPSKRLTAEQVIGHRWFVMDGNQLVDHDLRGNARQLRKFMVLCRFRQYVYLVTAINRMKKISPQVVTGEAKVEEIIDENPIQTENDVPPMLLTTTSDEFGTPADPSLLNPDQEIENYEGFNLPNTSVDEYESVNSQLTQKPKKTFHKITKKLFALLRMGKLAELMEKKRIFSDLYELSVSDEYDICGFKPAVRKEDGLKVSVKIAEKTKNAENEIVDDRDELQQEYKIMRMMDHSHIIKPIELIANDNRMYLIAEYVEGNSLANTFVDENEVFSEKEGRDIIVKILLIVKHMHDLNIVHRELRPVNFICSADEEGNIASIKLVGFSSATKVEGCDPLSDLTDISAPSFAAPELLMGHGIPHGKPVDMWSLGVMLYKMLSGKEPFPPSTEVITDNITSENGHHNAYNWNPSFDDEKWDNISNLAQNYIKGLLAFNPHARLSINEALFDHAWLKEDLDYHNEETNPSPAAHLLGSLRTNHSTVPMVPDRVSNQLHKVVRASIQLKKMQKNFRKRFLEARLPHTIHARYIIQEELGHGSFGVVYKGISKIDKSIVAIKMMHVSKVNRQDLREEVNILRRLDHPFIMKCYDLFEEGPDLYEVLELLDGGDVIDHILSRTHFTEEIARDCAFAVLSALHYMHEHNIIHRDLKPDNLIVAKFVRNDADLSQIKIIDMGFAKYIESLGRYGSIGTINYMAPEVTENKPYGKPCDMWSFGCILYILLCGQFPFQHRNRDALARMIRQGSFQFHSPVWKNVSEEAKSLIQGLLCVNQKKRLTAAEALSHPWFAEPPSRLSSIALDDNLAELRSFQIKRKFRKIVNTIRFAQRMSIFSPNRNTADALPPVPPLATTSTDEQEFFDPFTSVPTLHLPQREASTSDALALSTGVTGDDTTAQIRNELKQKYGSMTAAVEQCENMINAKNDIITRNCGNNDSEESDTDLDEFEDAKQHA
eukprot:gene9554-12867_t